MEEAPENSKESSHSAHANGVNEWMNIIHLFYLCHLICCFFVYKCVGYQIQHKNGQLEILIGKGISVNYLYRLHADSWSSPLVIVRLKTSWMFCMVTILYYIPPRSYHIKSCIYSLLPCLISEFCVKWHWCCSHITNIDTCNGFF